VKKVLFVCSGNTCRSPMAKELFTRFLSCREGGSLAYEYQASSAGIWAADGLPASPDHKRFQWEKLPVPGFLSSWLPCQLIFALG
jgi:protein-tyrosine-phosphatase